MLVLLALIGTSLFAAAETLIGRVVTVANGDTIWHHPGKSDTLISEKMITEVSNATQKIHGGVQA